jgi:CDP-diacylglycerol pyrophosphatase
MTHSRRLSFGILMAFALLLIAGFIVASKKRVNSDALWKIVHGRCLPDIQTNGNPSPCLSVALAQGEAHGFAILKDNVGNTQYLLIPTEKITGIESPLLLDPHSSNYFSSAWTATDLVDQRVGHELPRSDFALAINSISGRSQDQLHIHIDCVQPEVRALLHQFGPRVGTTWQEFPSKLDGHHYRAMWIPGDQLNQQNPFHLLAQSLTNPAKEMGAHTLVLVGDQRDGRDGFILLDGEAPIFAVAVSPWIRLGFAAGEELEDHQCRVANGS